MDPGFVGEGVGATDRLVRRERDAGRLRDRPAEPIEPLQLDGVDIVRLIERDGDLLQRDVASALADAHHGSVDGVGARLQARVDVRHAETEIVVGMEARRAAVGERAGRRPPRCAPGRPHRRCRSSRFGLHRRRGRRRAGVRGSRGRRASRPRRAPRPTARGPWRTRRARRSSRPRRRGSIPPSSRRVCPRRGRRG